MINQPLMKWTGSKRHIAKEIISEFPKQIRTYYEPFLGGGSVLWRLMQSDVSVDRYVASDKNEHLIKIYKQVQADPMVLIDSYTDNWSKLKNDKNHYYIVRDMFNESKDHLLFFFLTRTCFNGTIRFNRHGEFNVSYHLNRDGINPTKLKSIVMKYNELISRHDVTFINQDYSCVRSTVDDLVYIDPPYTDSDGLYYGNIDMKSFVSWLDSQPRWFMNMNGRDNHIDFDINYTYKKELFSGNSSFSRLHNKQVEVNEFFFVRNEIASERG